MTEEVTNSDNLTQLQRNFLNAYRKTMGNISAACNQVKISRQTYYRWEKESPEFLQAVEDLKEEVIDFVETQLFKSINGYDYEEITKENYQRDGKQVSDTKTVTKHIEPNVSAIKFFLETKAKHRGYIRESKIEHRGEVKTNIPPFVLQVLTKEDD
jgi:DNA-binding XRE family transcriptional regulator